VTNTSGKDERKQRLEADRERREQLRQQAPPAFKSVYGQLMAASTLGGGLSPGQEAALRDLDGIMATAEHVIRGVPVGAGAHSTICALLMDAYAKGQQSCRSASA
jgi:hypothetical protein